MQDAQAYSDQELFIRFRTGNDAAFTAVYDRFYFPLLQYIRRWLENTQEAEDVVADAFIKLLDRREQMNSLDNIPAFLFVTARNACINSIKRSRLREDKIRELTRESEAETDPVADWLATEDALMQLIYAEVDKMAPQTRAVFLLSYKEGLKPAEIAERLQIHVHTVSNHKTNGVRLLRSAFANRPVMLVALLLLERVRG